MFISFQSIFPPIKHIEFLKHCRTYCVNVVWNLLVQVPGEREEWIGQIVGIIPSLTHLMPPVYRPRPIRYQKYSAYTNNPRDYELDIRPVETYGFIYPDDGDFAGLGEKIAYIFEPSDKKQRNDYYEVTSPRRYSRLAELVTDWNEKFHRDGDTMVMLEHEDRTEIIDLRAMARKNLVILTDAEKEIYARAENAVNKQELFSKLNDRFDLSQIELAAEKLLEDKLMLEIDGEILALASKKSNHHYRPARDFPMGGRLWETVEKNEGSIS